MELPLSFSSVFLLQVRYVTAASLRARYRKTLVGFLWVILNPLILFGVQCLIFTYVLNINSTNYPLFLASGLLPWLFVCQSVEMGTPVFVNSSRLLKSFAVHPMVYLAAQLTDNLVSFISAFLVIVGAMLFHSPDYLIRLPLLILPIFFLYLGVLGLTWMLAIFQVFFRDTRFIATFLLSLGYFLTPIFYPLERLPPAMRSLSQYNPIHLLILPFRILVYSFSYSAFCSALFQAGLVSVIFLVSANLLWRLKRNAIYFHL